MNTLPTNNPAWGFWNEVARDTDKATATAKWEEASTWLQKTYGLEPVDARNFLDSRHGRHLADALTHMTFDDIRLKWAKFMLKVTREVAASRNAFEA